MYVHTEHTGHVGKVCRKATPSVKRPPYMSLHDRLNREKREIIYLTYKIMRTSS